IIGQVCLGRFVQQVLVQDHVPHPATGTGRPGGTVGVGACERRCPAAVSAAGHPGVRVPPPERTGARSTDTRGGRGSPFGPYFILLPAGYRCWAASPTRT